MGVDEQTIAHAAIRVVGTSVVKAVEGTSETTKKGKPNLNRVVFTDADPEKIIQPNPLSGSLEAGCPRNVPVLAKPTAIKNVKGIIEVISKNLFAGRIGKVSNVGIAVETPPDISPRPGIFSIANGKEETIKGVVDF